MNTFEKSGKILPYQIIIKRNRNTYFRIRNGMLVITTNRLTTKKVILSYIDLKFDQFYQQLQIQTHQEPDDHIMLWGHHYSLSIEHGRFAYTIDEDHINARSLTNDIDSIKKRIYLSEMRKKLMEILPVVEQSVQSKGILPTPIKLKYLKSKFGSYHRKNMEITLNTYLSRLDPIYTSYVLYHEYAHAKVFDHSKHFYSLLGELMPKHKEYQKALKKYVIS